MKDKMRDDYVRDYTDKNCENCRILRSLTVDEIKDVHKFIEELKQRRKK